MNTRQLKEIVVQQREEIKENFEYITEKRVKCMKNLAQYIEEGGFPEYLKYL